MARKLPNPKPEPSLTFSVNEEHGEEQAGELGHSRHEGHKVHIAFLTGRARVGVMMTMMTTILVPVNGNNSARTPPT